MKVIERLCALKLSTKRWLIAAASILYIAWFSGMAPWLDSLFPASSEPMTLNEERQLRNIGEALDRIDAELDRF